jgi:hypothetical protein
MTTETQFGEVDIYGQRHPIETPELIEMRLKELEEELEVVAKKDSWVTAQEKCAPELIGRDFKLLFLRARKFQAKVGNSGEPCGVMFRCSSSRNGFVSI